MFSHVPSNFVRKQQRMLKSLQGEGWSAAQFLAALPTAVEALYARLEKADPLEVGPVLVELAALAQGAYEKLGLPTAVRLTEESDASQTKQ